MAETKCSKVPKESRDEHMAWSSLTAQPDRPIPRTAWAIMSYHELLGYATCVCWWWQLGFSGRMARSVLNQEISAPVFTVPGSWSVFATNFRLRMDRFFCCTRGWLAAADAPAGACFKCCLESIRCLISRRISNLLGFQMLQHAPRVKLSKVGIFGVIS